MKSISTIFIRGFYIFLIGLSFGASIGTQAQTCSSPLVSMSVSTQNLRCNGDLSGSIAVTISAGSATVYTYSLYSVVLDPIIINNYPINNYTFSNLPADNNYFLVIQVPIGGGAFAFCSQSITLTEPPQLSISSASIINTTCNGRNDGAINATVTGGPTTPYDYSWSNGATTEDISGLTAGNYTLTIIDGNNCSTSKTFTVSEPTPITSAAAIVDVTCFGKSDGAIALITSGGTAPYSYLWNTGATTSALTNVPAGTYTVTHTDSKGCKNSQSFTVAQPSSISALTPPPVITNVICSGTNTGAIDVTTSGGTPAYTFTWSNGATTEDLSGVSAGSYSLTVTDSKGCPTSIGPYVVTENPPIVLTSLPTITNVTCNGESNGSISISPTGGIAPYTYLWTNGATSQNITALSTGNYSVKITDSQGCSRDIGPFTVTEPTAITAFYSATNATCNGGATGNITQTSISGGTSGYTYLWTNGTTTANLANVAAGNYSLTVTDSKSCSKTFGPFTVNEPGTIAATPTITNVTCNAGSNGSIALSNLAGGTPDYTYLWSNGSIAQTLTGVPAGSYSVIITDSKNCKNSLGPFSITEPASVSAVTPPPVITHVICNGTNTGSIDATPSGGTPGYTYLWSNGATTEDLVNIPAGNYSLTVTDSKNCSAAIGPYAVTQNPPISLTSLPSITNASCNGSNSGSISINPTGGNAPYTYLWSNGATTQNISAVAAGNYSVTITDNTSCSKTFGPYIITDPAPITAATVITNASCNGTATGSIILSPAGGTAGYTYSWSNGSTTKDLTNVIAGNYTVTIIDSKSCTKVFGPFIISQPVPITATGTIVNVACHGNATGSISISSLAGGTFPYTYSWNNGITTKDISGLIAGTYTLTIKDASGCSIILPAFTITEPTTIAATNTITNISCNGGATGAINVTTTGGTLPYTFSWSNGVLTKDLTAVAAGSYTLTITDKNGCTKIVGPLTISQNPPISLTSLPVITNVTCNGASTGSISISPTGGNVPYTYLWTNGATTQNLSAVPVGNYSVKITDNTSCSKTFGPYAITEPAPITAATVITDVSCNGTATGSIVLSAAGGTAGYTYVWSNGATTKDLTNVIAGGYTVTITDSKSCTKVVGPFTINQPVPITATGTIVNVTCNGGATGSISISSQAGGTIPYTYSWNNGATQKDISGLTAGSYTLTIKDANGCSIVLPAFTVTSPTPIVSVGAVTNVGCNGTATGAINISTPTGGVGPYTYAWSNGKTSQNNPSLTAGSYSVTITDASGCTLILPFTITEPAPLVATQTITNVSCNGGSNGSITLSTSGGASPYTYIWSNGVTTQNNPAISAGSYSVVVTDNNGCSKTFGPFIIIEPSAPITAIGTAASPSCNGSASGSITLETPTGGTPIYTYLWSNGATTQNLTNVIGGDYSVTITDSKGCSNIVPISFTITPGISISGTAVAAPAAICSGQGTVITASIDAAYTPAANAYSFNGGTTFQASPTLSITTIIADTTITVVIKDVNGCLSDPIALNIQTNKIAGGVLSVSKPIACFGNTSGELTMTIPGNTSGIQYSLNGSAFQSSNVFPNLPAGSYTVVVNDGGSCNSSYTAILTEPALLTIGIKTISDVNACISNNNGSIAVTANGGNGGNAGRTFTIHPSGASQSDSLFNNLIAGTYTITVTDTKGCTASIDGTVNSSIPVSITSVNNTVNCTNPLSGSIDVSVTGGAAPYTYLWNDGSINQDLLNLSAGTYKVIVTDSKGCKDSLTVIINNTPLITGTATASPATVCSGQSSTVTGVFDPAYTPASSGYSFDGGTTFQTSAGFIIPSILADTVVHVVLKDINSCLSNTIAVSIATSKINATVAVSKLVSCNGGNDGEITVTANGNTAGYTYSINGGSFQSSPVFSNLIAGTYTVVIDDGSACNSSYTVLLTDPSAITLAVASTVDINPCAGGNNGSITVTSTGGNGGNMFSITPSGLPQSSSSFTGLTAGSYTITVKDSKGCSATASATLTQPTGLDTSLIKPIIVDNKCAGNNDGKISLTNLPGAISSYTYTLNGTSNKTSIFTGLLAGNYTMIITDVNNCSVNYNFKISAPEKIGYTADEQSSSCNKPDGSIHFINVTGGTAPYKYTINKGQAYSPDPLFTNLAAGIYHLEVIDINNCGASSIDTVTTKTAPVPYIRIQQPTCNTGKNGFAVVDSVSGGVPLFQFNFNGFDVGSTTVYSNLKAGSYTLQITDQACTYDIDSFYVYNETTHVYDTLSAPKITITEPKPISGKVLSVDADRYENSGVAIIYDIEGGKPNYNWSSDNINYKPVVHDTIFLNYLSRGNHIIYVQDTNGCLGTFDIMIHVQFFIPNLISPNKDGKNDRFEIMALPVGSEMKIVNRWGNQVYISENYDNSWDADQDSDGIYYYELTLPNGDRHKGWVEVIR